MTFMDELLRRTPDDIERLYRRALDGASGYGGLFGVCWDGGGYQERAEAREAFGRYWRERREAAERRVSASDDTQSGGAQ